MTTAPAKPVDWSALEIDRIAADVTARLSDLADAAASRVQPPRADGVASPQPQAADEVVPNPYEEAAAVLAWFDPSTLQPMSVDPAPGDEARRKVWRDELLIGSSLIADATGRRRWALRPARRVARLRSLRESGRVDAALQANTGPGSEPAQRALSAALKGQTLPVSDAGLLELKAFHEAATWLQAAGFTVTPSAVELASRIDWRSLLQPFEHIAGDNFKGRADELRQLRDFANVLPPRGVLEGGLRVAGKAFDAAQAFLTRSPKVALVVSGPGGVGKSTLVARFILEHAQAHEDDRFPFAYLDFDRPDVVTDEPLTLLTEAVRQLGIEYPEVRESCERLRQGWLAQLAEWETRGNASATARANLRAAAVRDAVHAIGGLAVGSRPILLVLDTFEEVQYHGDKAVQEIWNFLAELRSRIPALRIVVAGRAELPMSGVKALALSTFDEDSAIAYLELKGVQDGALARQIFRQFGGSPLTLKLAAELAQRDPREQRFDDVETRDGFLRRLSDENVQRQLYRRVLKHIHDPEVKKLAHPGLLLRRITAEAILEVLAEPCEVKVATLDEAQVLFAKLAREVSLVRKEPDGSLRHRQDLRALMLEPLQIDDRERARNIHERAVRFFAARPGDVERAEEIYHRLWLDEPLAAVEERWTRGVRAWLSSAMPEFDPRRRAFLGARMNIPVDDAARRAARLSDWERLSARLAQILLDDGDAPAALVLLDERVERSIDSPLPQVQAAAYAALGRNADAVGTLDRAYVEAASARSGEAALRLALALAETVVRAALPSALDLATQRLDGLLASTKRAVPRLHALALRAFIADLRGSVALDASDESELNRCVVAMKPSTLARSRDAACWAAAAPGHDARPRLLHVLRAVGLPRASDTRMRELALALTRADVSHSLRQQLQPGVLARRHSVPTRDSITESWSAFVLEAPAALLSSCVLDVLTLGELDGAGSALLAAVQGVFAEERGVAAAAAAVVPTQVLQPDAPRAAAGATMAGAAQRLQLVDAIVDAFTLDDLRITLRRRLGRVIEAYSSTDSLREAVFSLVDAAAHGGWLVELAAALVDARADDPALAFAASAVGLRTLVGDSQLDGPPQGADQRPLRPPVMTNTALDAWRRRLGQIERATCRIDRLERPAATGFLVDHDLVLTCSQVVLESSDHDTSELLFRFDIRADHDGAIVSPGAVYKCARSGVVAIGNHDLPYALLRAEGSPGAQPMGGSATESTAVLRRWLPVVPAPAVLPGMSLALAHYPQGRPLTLSIGEAVQGAGLAYRIAVQAGSAGAPCFDAERLDLLGLHVGAQDAADSRSDIGQGLTMQSIVEHARTQGVDLLALEAYR